MLNSQHLHTFKTLVEVQSFTQAAKTLGLTQPAVTQHIQKLERDLGKQLVIRHGRRTELTAAGEVLYQHVLELLNQYQAFMQMWQTVETDGDTSSAA